MNAHSPIIGSPLHVACSEYIENRSVLLELLLAAGADPNVVVKSEDGYFLRPVLGEYLQSNQQQLSMEVIQLLLQHGTRVGGRFCRRHRSRNCDGAGDRGVRPRPLLPPG